MLELHNIPGNPDARKKRKRVGRGPGSGRGKTSGKGHKGQKSRSGYSRKLGFEGGQMPLNRRLPKRGFTQTDRFPMAIVNVDVLERAFEAGDEITPETIAARGLAPKQKGGLKLLGRGELTKKLTVKVHAVSPGAKQKVEAAGGTVELLERARRQSKKAAADSESESGSSDSSSEE